MHRGVLFIFLILCSLSHVFSFQGGNGSSLNPYQISTCLELQNMTSSLSSDYILISDIDCSLTPTWNMGLGFRPIGNSSNPFEGNFNGSNYVISDLFINRSSEDRVGLFGDMTGGFGSTTNIGYFQIENAQIIGNNEVGILGSDFGFATTLYVRNISASGTVTGNDDVGGFSGYSYGIEIYNSSFSGTIIANNNLGGFVGNSNGGRVDHSQGDVVISGSNNIGGIFGLSLGIDIFNSYVSVDIEGNNNLGGIGGYMEKIVIDSYATGIITGNDSLGGIAGRRQSSGGGNYLNNFVSVEINGNSNTGLFFGTKSDTLNMISNNYAYNYSGNTNPLTGTGNIAGLNQETDITYFYDCSNEPFLSWDLTNYNCTGSSFLQFNWDPIVEISEISSSSSTFPIFNSLSLLLTLILLLLYFN